MSTILVFIQLPIVEAALNTNNLNRKQTMSETEKMVKWEAEYTDTFSGEANYSWMTRKEFELPENASDLAVVRKAKALIGLNGVSCKRMDMGDTIALYPCGCCTVLFITPIY